MDIKKWKEINAFYCEKLKAWISPEQCEANRNRPEEYTWSSDFCNNGSFVYLKPEACKNCKDWRGFCEKVYKKRKEHEKMANKAKMIKCAECGKETYNYGRGLCCQCYYRLKKEGRLPPTKRKIKTSKVQDEEFKIVVDFSNIPDVFEFIKQKADKELRSIEMQILWELKSLAKG